MNRRTLVLSVGGLVAAGFAGGAFYLTARQKTEQEKADNKRPEVPNNFLVRPYSPILGSKDAKVTLVEFFDPSCEACRAFHPTVKQLLDRHANILQVVVRYAAFHEGSDEAVRILETARMQNKFEPVLEALLAKQPSWAVHGRPNLALAWQIARDAGLNIERAKSDSLFPGITAILNQDAEDVKAANVRQTPTFFLNGKMVELQDRGSLQEAVDAAIAEAG